MNESTQQLQHKVTLERQYRDSILAWLHLARIYNRVAHEHTLVLNGHNLTSPQFDLLNRVGTEPGLSQQELASRLLVTKGNICGVADRLEKAGLITRHPDPDDRRSNQVFLTEEGRATLENAVPDVTAMVAEQLMTLDEEELRTLMKLLAKIDRSMRDSATP